MKQDDSSRAGRPTGEAVVVLLAAATCQKDRRTQRMVDRKTM
jgi:hypothetical protein